MHQRVKPWGLRLCMFLFLFVVLGNVLHLSMTGALLAAVTGVVLTVHLYRAVFRALYLLTEGRPLLAATKDTKAEWWRDHLAEIHTRKAGPPNNRTDRGDS